MTAINQRTGLKRRKNKTPHNNNIIARNTSVFVYGIYAYIV